MKANEKVTYWTKSNIYRNLQGNHYSQFEAGLKFAAITNYSKQKNNLLSRIRYDLILQNPL